MYAIKTHVDAHSDEDMRSYLKAVVEEVVVFLQ